MAQGRIGVGVAVLFALAGTAAAQQPFPVSPGAPGPSGGAGPLPSLFPPVAPVRGPGTPAVGVTPAGSPPAAPGSALATPEPDHGPLKELSTAGLPDLVPPADEHAHGEHAVPEYLKPFVPEHGGWYADGEFLLMRARNSDMDYAINGSNAGLGTVGPINSLNYQLGAGLRTELGYRFGAQGKWEAAFAYTYFGDHAGNLLVAGPGQVLYPTITRPGLTDTAQSANASANLNYNLFDLIIGRSVMVDENFALRWLGGFRFTDIRQNYSVGFNGGDARQDAVNTRSRFQGFGPIVGLEAVLGGWHGLHMYARATVGLISGLSSNALMETNDAGATTYVNTSNDVRKVVPTGSLAIGGGWQYRTLSIRAGYQITYWDGVFERPRFTDDVTPGKLVTRPSNLTLEGVFFQVGLSF